MSARVLSLRELNRALLERQLLLRRSSCTPADALEWLVGLQAQVPTSPYFALWSRLADFDPDELSQLITHRAAVRLALFRSTIHLVSARDCVRLRPVVQAFLERQLVTGTPFGRHLMGIDRAALESIARRLLEEQPRTMAQLGQALQPYFADRDATSMAYGARAFLPLVQVPPRGLWGRGGLTRLTTAEAWLGRASDTQTAPDAMIVRYLAAFGPASVRDVQAWSGLSRLREAVDRLRPRLRTFADERGVELFDVREGPLPGGDAPAPVRFLPDFDNVLLAHADRRRIFPRTRHERWAAGNIGTPTVLIDGFVGATWKIVRTTGAATLRVEAIEPLSEQDRDAIAVEGARLLEFAAADRAVRKIELATRL